MLTKPEPCKFANDLFIFSANPEMLEELRTEEEVNQFHEHLSQEPLCAYCLANARPLMEFFAGLAASGATAEELIATA